MIKVDASVSMNEYPGAIEQLNSFAAEYGLLEDPWYPKEKQRILNVGFSEAYKKAPLPDRILSTNSITLPDNDVIELDYNSGDSAGETAVANGPASPGDETQLFSKLTPPL